MSVAGLVQGEKRNHVWFVFSNLAALPRASRANIAEVNAIMWVCRAGVLHTLLFFYFYCITVVVHYSDNLPALGLG